VGLLQLAGILNCPDLDAISAPESRGLRGCIGMQGVRGCTGLQGSPGIVLGPRGSTGITKDYLELREEYLERSKEWIRKQEEYWRDCPKGDKGPRGMMGVEDKVEDIIKEYHAKRKVDHCAGEMCLDTFKEDFDVLIKDLQKYYNQLYNKKKID